MFDVFDERDWTQFVCWTMLALVIGGVIGYAAHPYPLEQKDRGVVVAAGAPSAPEFSTVPENCADCLPRCFQVYNKTRTFGMTVRAVEEGWIR